MKSLLLILTTLMFSWGLAAAPRKFALLVAVGNYPENSGWQRINSLNDVQLIRKALQQQGFPEENITVVTDADATRAGILSAIQKHLLGRIAAGDIAYFQFSGHGQQVQDDNGDEVDGFDEAIVPYDSPLRYVAGVYEGQNLIRDEELGGLFRQVRARLGAAGNLLVMIDACHSGTGTRGLGLARGTDVVMADTAYLNKFRKQSAERNHLLPTGVAEDTELAPMVSFFGAAPNQLNFEAKDEGGNPVGSLSYAFAKRFSAAPDTTTYRALFDQIKLEMSAIAPRQQPQAEGKLDQEVLGGAILGNPDYLKPLRWTDDYTVTLDGGWLRGINAGTVVGLYPLDTRDYRNKTPLARGVVTRALAHECVVELEQALGREQAMGAWAYILEQNFGDLSVNLRFQNPDGPVTRALAAAWQSVPVIKPVEPAELVLVEKNGLVQLFTAQDMPLAERAATQPLAAIESGLKKTIFEFAQGKFLRNLDAPGGEIDLVLELVPIELDHATLQIKRRIPLAEKTDADGVVSFGVGDVFLLRVTNRGAKTAYFNILDIQPDNQINILAPYGTAVPEDLRVRSGESVELPDPVQVGPPAGMEIFKLIAAPTPLDLRPVASSRGSVGHKANNPLEKLFAITYINEECLTRGGKTISLASGSTQIATISFVIRP